MIKLHQLPLDLKTMPIETVKLKILTTEGVQEQEFVKVLELDMSPRGPYFVLITDWKKHVTLDIRNIRLYFLSEVDPQVINPFNYVRPASLLVPLPAKTTVVDVSHALAEIRKNELVQKCEQQIEAIHEQIAKLSIDEAKISTEKQRFVNGCAIALLTGRTLEPKNEKTP